MANQFSKNILLYLVFTIFFSSFASAKILQQTDSGSHELAIRKVIFFDNNTKLISVADKKVRLWDIESGELLKTFRTQSFKGSGGSLYNATLTNNDKYLILGGFLDKENSTNAGDLLVVDTKSFKVVKVLRAHKQSISWMASTKNYFATIDLNKELMIWDAKKLKLVKKFKVDYLKRVVGIALNDDATKAYISGYLKIPKKKSIVALDLGAIVEIDLQSGQQTKKSEMFETRYVQYNDKTIYYSTNYVGFIPADIHSFDEVTRKKKLVASLKGERIRSFCKNPKTDELFVSGIKDSYLFHGKNKKEFIKNNSINECAYSNDGKLLALGDSDGSINIYDSNKKKIFSSPESSKKIASVGFGKDGKTIAWGDVYEQSVMQSTIFDEHPFINAINLKNGVEHIKPEPFSENYTRPYSTYKDFEIFTTEGGPSNVLKVYNKGKPWLNIKSYKNFHTSATLIPNSLFVIAGSATGDIIAYELRYGSVVHKFKGHSAGVTSISVSQDGKYLISGSVDKTIKIWSLKKIKFLLKYQKPNRAFIDKSVASYKKNKGFGDVLRQSGYTLDYKGIVRFKQDYGLPLSHIPPESKPLATIFASNNEWIIWNEDGYYASSPLGDEKIGWNINGKTKKEWSNWIGANQFERALYHPKFISEWILSHGNRKLYSKYNLDKNALSKLLQKPPTKAKILLPKTASKFNTNKAQLSFSLDKSVDSYTVFVNDIPIVHEKKPKAKRYKKDIPLFNKFNKVHIETIDKGAMAKSNVLIKSSKNKPPKGDLYLLSIGVKNFKHLKNKDLRYTTNDAKEIVKHYEKQAGKSFNSVHTKLIVDEIDLKPTKNNIQNAVSFIKKAKAKDTVIIFLASHGISDINGNYYFVPQDAKSSDLKNLDDPKQKVSSMVPWNLFFDELQSTLGKRLLIVDTCESKNISGKYELYSLIKRSASSSFAILTASKGNELSQEFYQEKHGLFTFALLEGLKGKADENKDKKITLQEAYEYASKIVFLNHDTRFGSQTPQLNGSKNSRDIILSTY